MKVEQIYTGCLAQGAYYIQSEGEAVIIDPLREIQPYVQKAERNGAKIKYVFETHFHADFVSGHIDLAKATLTDALIRRLLLLSCGTWGQVVRVIPPLVTTEAEVDQAIEIIGSAIREATTTA